MIGADLMLLIQSVLVIKIKYGYHICLDLIQYNITYSNILTELRNLVSSVSVQVNVL
eukprot:SAG31_NODE_2566_length_5466_cov_6.677846_2_plen_57_part_00